VVERLGELPAFAPGLAPGGGLDGVSRRPPHPGTAGSARPPGTSCPPYSRRPTPRATRPSARSGAAV